MVDFTDSGRENFNRSRGGQSPLSVSLADQLVQLQTIAEYILENIEDDSIQELNRQRLIGQKLCSEILEKNPQIFKIQHEFIVSFFHEELTEKSNHGALLMISANVINSLDELMQQQEQESAENLNLHQESFPEMKRRN